MKNVDLANQSSDTRADHSDFIGPSVYVGSIYKGDLTLSVFLIYL